MNEFLWLHYSLPRTSWYELDETERARYEAAFEEQRVLAERAGASRSGRFHVRGQSDYSHVEVWNFPSAEAAFEHWSRMVTAEYAEYFEFANQLGMADGGAQQKERNS